MKTIGYARVSSREQAENSKALEQQIDRLKMAGAEEILFDVEAGRKDDRRCFNHLMQLVREGLVDEVVFTRLDRMTRSLPTLRKTIDEFKKSGINLKVLDDGIDLNTAAGKFQINMLGALAEMEVDRLSERVRHGYQHLKNQQVAMNPPFGYQAVDNRHYLDHRPYKDSGKSRAEVARDLIETFLEIGTLRGTIRAMNLKYGASPPNQARRQNQDFPRTINGVSRWMTSPVLQGHLVYYTKPRVLKEKTITYNTHSEQRLVTPEEAQKIQELLQLSREGRGWGAVAKKYPLSGLIYCGECKKGCYQACGKPPKQSLSHHIYYRCANYPSRACKQKHSIREDRAEAAVIKALLARAEAIAQMADHPPEHTEPLELKELRSQLSQLESIPGYQPAIESAKQDVRLQIQSFQHELSQEQQAKSGNRDLLLDVCSDPSFWRTQPPEDKREIYRKLVDRIMIRNGAVESVSLKV